MKTAAAYIAFLAAALAASYGLALAGEPQSLWLWSTLGLL